jgi:hypothetical protein
MSDGSNPISGDLSSESEEQEEDVMESPPLPARNSIHVSSGMIYLFLANLHIGKMT